MHEMIATRIPQLEALCRRHRVKALWAFGSATTEDFDPARSDIDLLVEFLPGTDGGFSHPYFGLLDDLRALFGRDVDLVMTTAVRNRYFRESLERSKAPIYAAA